MMPTLLVTGTCTGYKRKLRLAPSHSAAQGRGPRGALKGPFGTLPLPPPRPSRDPDASRGEDSTRHHPNRNHNMEPIRVILDLFWLFRQTGFAGLAWRRPIWLGNGGRRTAGGTWKVWSHRCLHTHTHHPRLLSYAVGGRVGCMSLLTSILAITALRINVQYIRLRASVHTSGQGSKESVHKCQL